MEQCSYCLIPKGPESQLLQAKDCMKFDFIFGRVGGWGKLCKDSLEISSLFMSLQARTKFFKCMLHVVKKKVTILHSFFSSTIWASTPQNLFLGFPTK